MSKSCWISHPKRVWLDVRPPKCPDPSGGQSVGIQGPVPCLLIPRHPVPLPANYTNIQAIGIQNFQAFWVVHTVQFQSSYPLKVHWYHHWALRKSSTRSGLMSTVTRMALPTLMAMLSRSSQRSELLGSRWRYFGCHGVTTRFFVCVRVSIS